MFLNSKTNLNVAALTYLQTALTLITTTQTERGLCGIISEVHDGLQRDEIYVCKDQRRKNKRHNRLAEVLKWRLQTLLDSLFDNEHAYYWGYPDEDVASYDTKHPMFDSTKDQRREGRISALYFMIFGIADGTYDITAAEYD